MDKAQSQAAGYIAGIIQAVLYATMGIFAKLLYESGLDAQLVMVLRFICTVIFLGLYILLFHERKFISRQPAVYVQSIFFFLSAWLYFLAVERISAGLTTVLFYTFPAIVAVMNVFVFHERLTARIVIALALSLCGIVLISGVLSPGQGTIDLLGVALAIGACISFAIYSVLIQKTARVESSFTATFTRLLRRRARWADPHRPERNRTRKRPVHTRHHLTHRALHLRHRAHWRNQGLHHQHHRDTLVTVTRLAHPRRDHRWLPGNRRAARRDLHPHGHREAKGTIKEGPA